MNAGTPQNVDSVTLTEAERDDFRAHLRQNLGYRAWVIEDTMLGHVERILAARLAPIVALADDLAAWDLVDMPAPESVDVPDDYELGMNHAGAQLHAALRTTPAPTGPEEGR